MRTEELLEQCLQALTSGEDLPPDLARYLARHPEQRAEIEDLLSIAQRASRMPTAELSPAARQNMQNRLATRLGFDPAALNAPEAEPAPIPIAAAEQTAQDAPVPVRKKPLLSIG